MQSKKQKIEATEDKGNKAEEVKDVEMKDAVEDEKQSEKKEEKKEEELTPEDQQLKALLEELVQHVTDKTLAEPLRRNALEQLKKEIRSSTSSMTAIPKPLKFLKPHYKDLAQFYGIMKISDNKTFLADILSVLAMTMAEEGTLESLSYKLSGTVKDLGSWGHEYVRHLAGEISTEWARRQEGEKSVDDLLALVQEIIPFHMTHNAEADACDLAIEVDQFVLLKPHINRDNYMRVCNYLTCCSAYTADREDAVTMLKTVYDCYFSVKDITNALRIAIKLIDKDLISECLQVAQKDRLLFKQCGFIMGQARLTTTEFEEDEEFMEVMGNQSLHIHFKNLARELDVQEAKSPEDIYKTNVGDGSSSLFSRRGSAAGPQKVDSAKQNLASSFVNAFVNCSYGTDTLVTPDGSDWMYKNKDHGMLSAAASLGMILLWDVDTGYSAIDKYSFSQQTYIKAGALLGTGIISSGIQSEMNAALGLLSEHVESSDATMKVAAIVGLGFAYGGTCNQDVLELLIPVLVDTSQTMEIASLSCLALGMVFAGTANSDIATTMFEALFERSETDLNDSLAHMMCLGLGLLFLNRGEDCETTLEALAAVTHPIQSFAKLSVEACAHFGTGSVLSIQRFLSVVGEHLDEEKEKESAHQAVAVLGIAMAAMGEEISTQMVLRTMDHIMQYGEVNVRRIVPLALGLLSVSSPDITIMDTLSKLSHDNDERVSQNAVLALGFLGAGTNNSRIANILRQLSTYYAKEPNHLFLVRISQGMLHMGKGLMTLSPYQSDHLLLSPVAAAGLLTVIFSAFDMKNSILSKRHYLLFSLVCAARPRMLITLDENLQSVAVKVRVGTAVDTVGQAGKPKTITGFQTHSTPVLLGFNERAELANDEWIPYSSVLEGFVIVRKNPNAVDNVE